MMQNENPIAYLKNSVTTALSSYFEHMEDHEPVDVYKLVLEEIEVPLLEFIMQHVNGNQCKAARLLGLNRGTLRKKLQQYQIS